MSNPACTAPIILLVFNRPDHTQRVLEEIRRATPPALLVVGDGPRPEVPGDTSACAAVRALFDHDLGWPVELHTHFAETNLGLRRRVASGLAWAFDLVPEAIVLEDDCRPAPAFFPFCCELLERYRLDTRIGVIAGDNFQAQPFPCASSYYFSKFAHCWGWGSWRRAWKLFDEPMTHWPALRNSGWLKTLFAEPGHVQYWQSIFDKVHRREMNSWALAWLFSCWSQSMLTILPKVNLVQNIGLDTQAHHTFHDNDGIWTPPVLELELPLRHPDCVVIEESADDYTQRVVFGTAIPRSVPPDPPFDRIHTPCVGLRI